MRYILNSSKLGVLLGIDPHGLSHWSQVCRCGHPVCMTWDEEEVDDLMRQHDEVCGNPNCEVGELNKVAIAVDHLELTPEVCEAVGLHHWINNPPQP